MCTEVGFSSTLIARDQVSRDQSRMVTRVLLAFFYRSLAARYDRVGAAAFVFIPIASSSNIRTMNDRPDIRRLSLPFE